MLIKVILELRYVNEQGSFTTLFIGVDVRCVQGNSDSRSNIVRRSDWSGVFIFWLHRAWPPGLSWQRMGLEMQAL